MHIKRIEANNFRRFTKLIIDQIPATAKLVVLIGPNGCGKTSLFDAFRTWHAAKGAVFNFRNDPIYSTKQGSIPVAWAQHAQIEFHEGGPASGQDIRKHFYFRSAYRYEADFTMTNLNNVGSALDSQRRVGKLMDNDASVSDNYQRLVSASFDGLYSGEYDAFDVPQLREKFIGSVKDSMKRVFADLVLKGPGHPLTNGSFFFDKGTCTGFHYKNLSSGEKAAFDLLLDMIVKSIEYNNTIFCIDEPETHMHTRLQASLLQEIYNLIPQNSQLWISTHSIGMMRKAKELHIANPGNVVFFDFDEKNFDTEVIITPTFPNRDFWSKTLKIALDDLADLVAPSQIVLCEGKPRQNRNKNQSEFDAYCYRAIFANEFPDTDFVSVGNDLEVQSDRLEVGKAIHTLIKGSKVIRLIDRDDRSPEEIKFHQADGMRVLSKRHLESYLLDDEILTLLCHKKQQPEKIAQILDAKKNAIRQIIQQGKPADDIKSAAGLIYVEASKILNLTQCGNDSMTFQRDTLVPLIDAKTEVYKQLRKDVFGI